MKSEEFATALTIFFKIVSINKGGAIFSRGNAIAALELLAKVRGSKTYLTCYVSDGHLRMIGQQIVCHLHTYRINILRKRHTICKGVKLVVEVVTTNVETLHDVLTQQVDLCIKTFSTNDAVNGFKEVLVHSGFNFGNKINQKKLDSEKNICTHLVRGPNVCIRNGLCPVFLLIPTVFSGCHTIFSLELLA